MEATSGDNCALNGNAVKESARWVGGAKPLAEGLFHRSLGQRPRTVAPMSVWPKAIIIRRAERLNNAERRVNMAFGQKEGNMIPI